MERTTDRQKAGWIIALTLIGWTFWLLPQAEDGLPDRQTPTTTHWIIWLTVNLIALIAVHYYWGRAARRFNNAHKIELNRQYIANRRNRINTLNRKYDA